MAMMSVTNQALMKNQLPSGRHSPAPLLKILTPLHSPNGFYRNRSAPQYPGSTLQFNSSNLLKMFVIPTLKVWTTILHSRILSLHICCPNQSQPQIQPFRVRRTSLTLGGSETTSYIYNYHRACDLHSNIPLLQGPFLLIT